MADGKVTIDTELNEDGAKKGISGLSKLGGIAGGVTKAIGAIGSVAVASAGALVKSSTEAYASYEQLAGGVETLFDNTENLERFKAVLEDSGYTAEQIANALIDYEDPVDTVMKNASNAYKTAGLSANAYMETVTGMASALNQSTGDLATSAELADMAITDMSDNANKMGSSMESITNAYSGFAKQNYTMLDNLKLGYGGTKEEMQRLLEDAQKISGVEYDLSSYADIVEAIHVVQTELGITGTTAKEASTTIEGSANMMKASWENLLVGIADDNADFDTLIQNFVDSVGTYAENILPRIEIALSGIGDLIYKLAPVIANAIPKLVSETLPKLIETGIKITQTLMDAIISALPQLMKCATQFLMQLVNYIIVALPTLIQAGFEIILQIANAIIDALPTLIPAVVECLLTILETLIDNVDMLIDASIQIIMALADGIINALPILIDKAPTIIIKLVKALVTNAPKLLDAGKECMNKLIMGIANNIPKLVDKGKELIPKVKDAILSKIGEVKDAGNHIVTGLWQGISDKFGWLTSQLKSFATNVTDKLKAFFGIHSPSRVMRDEVGQWLAKGVSVGFTENNPMNEINATMQKGMNKLSDLSLNYSANMGYNGIIDYDKMADAFSKSGMPITFKGREFGRIVRSYV